LPPNLPHKMTVLGIMSGTSLDGLDLALCEFELYGLGFRYKIKAAKTLNYSVIWKKRLMDVKNANAEDYFALHAAYGKFIAEEVSVFMKASGETIDAIASHGHTVFHQPIRGFSTQIGCGATIAAHTGITTVCDFRSTDVANGGQGAPLVPIGDQMLFGEFEACLNIGGIANISYNNKIGKRLAYDVCVANMLLNYLAEKVGIDFDKGGKLARSGKIDSALLSALNDLDYYKQRGAKSIGREWFEREVKSMIDTSTLKTEDLLSTSTEHIASRIATEISERNLKKVLVTGGGAFNTFLMERLRALSTSEVILPKDVIINFKEALIFAFLGYLRLQGKTNSLGSVTGAEKNSIGGAVYLPS
jgi:anhydro-N-acetylmuramic acid kinase